MKEQLSLLSENMHSRKSEPDLQRSEDTKISLQKTCDTCKLELPVAEFHKNSYKPDNLASTCKTCSKGNSDRKKQHYTRLITQQDGKCAICDKTAEENKKDFAVDHSHETGIIRGALCNHCNSGLGSFLDKPELLLKAIDYLERTG